MALTKGTQLGPYEILSKLGEGGMGEVYLAKDRRLGRKVAIKVLPERLANDDVALMSFQEENKKVAALSHPNIRILFDIGTDKGQTFAVMEFLEGETLAERLERSPIEWLEAVRIALAAAAGLAAAHGKGIVHRDIKPHNIFLTESGEVKILDFGLALISSRKRDQQRNGDTTITYHGLADGFFGTISYMSPEQISSSAADARSDIFAFGTVLYEMLTAIRLFFRKSPVETAAAVLHDTPPPLDKIGIKVPPKLQQLIDQCLEKDPDDRIQTMREVISGLMTIASDSSRKKHIHPASIAVLPFENMSAEKENDYFSDGLTEELINALVKIGGLQVASRTSTALLKGKTEDVRAIGDQLGVRTVVEGSVRKAGDHLRITAQLINAEDGYHLLSKTFDRKVKDVFSVQCEIAEEIAKALRVVLTEKEKQAIAKAPTENMAAYDFLLRGRQEFYQFQRKGFERALSLFLRAAKLDPNFAGANAWVSYCYAILYSWFDADEANLYQAENASRKAISLDPDLAEAHVARGMVLYLKKEMDKADQRFETALRLKPDLYEAAYFFARNCFSQGKYEKAAKLAAQATELRPDDYNAPYLLGMIYMDLGRHKEAEEAFHLSMQRAESTLELFPDDARALSFGAGALNHLGKKQQALDWTERAFATSPEEPMTLYAVACNFAMLGNPDKAVSCLERARLFGSLPKKWLENDPDLNSLRQRPRFQAFLARLKDE